MFQNLLSKNRKKELTVEYALRVLNMTLFFFILGIGVGVIALFPSYIHVKGEIEQKEREYSDRQTEVEANKKLSEELEYHQYMTYVLKDMLEQKKFTNIFKEVTDLRPERVTIIGFSYNRKENRMTLEGVAKTRDLVAPFARTLEESEYFELVPIPISDLAKNTDLPFTLDMQMAKE